LLEGPTHGYTEAAIYVNNPHASGKLISLLQGGTELFMVTAGGKVGIGSTPASEYLVTIKQNGTQLYLRCSDADTGWIFDVPNSNDALQIYQRTAGSNTFRYHIDANGAHYMDAGADQVLGLNAASAPFLAWYRGGNRKAYMQSSTTSLAIVQEENLPLFFYTNSALRMFISAGGNVGIGDAQDASFCLTVKHSPNAVLARFWATHATYGSHVHQLLATRAANSSYSFLTCYSDASGSIDLEFQLLGDGNAYCDGAWNGGGADYAEYFESADGSPIPPGTTVVLVGDKVRPALASDAREDVIGVVRPRGASAAAGNAAHTRWTGKYLRGAFGGYDLDQDGKRRPSPAYDASREYVAARAAAGVDRSGASRAGADPGRPADASRLAAYESTFSG
jgi:hypothetical protein